MKTKLSLKRSVEKYQEVQAAIRALVKEKVEKETPSSVRVPEGAVNPGETR